MMKNNDTRRVQGSFYTQSPAVFPERLHTFDVVYQYLQQFQKEKPPPARI